MFKNFIKTTLHSLKKNFGFSIINILGLAVGIASSVLIFLFIRYELSYDRYNEKADRIYRVAQKIVINNSIINQAACAAPLPEAMYKEFPEVEAVTRIWNMGSQTFSYGDKTFVEKRVKAVDTTFFDIFNFQFVQGIAKGALNQPNTVVITESIAKKYFGTENPINKSIKIVDDNLRITGVIKDMPENSHFHFDFMISLLSFDGTYNDQSWDWNKFAVYFLLQKGHSYKDLEAKMPQIVDLIFDGKYKDFVKRNNGNSWNIYFQPLLDIHLKSDIDGEFEPNGKRSYISIFFIVAVFILLIACINFMNLSTAKSSNRAREVGVKKVVGARKVSIISQFLGESLITSTIALVLGMAIVETLLPAFGNMMGRHLELHYFNNCYVIPSLILLTLILGVVSGSYPAFFLSSFKPISLVSH